MKMSFFCIILLFLYSTVAWSREGGLNDFNLKFSIPAPAGDITTYIYLIDDYLMIEKNINRICVSGNQTTYSLTRIPAKSIIEVRTSWFGGESAVFVVSDEAGVESKRTILIDCFGQSYEPLQGTSTIILTGSDEVVARSISDRIATELEFR